MRFLTLLLLTMVGAGQAWAEVSGTGTEGDPYVVTTWGDLQEKMAAGGYIRLDADVSDPDKTSGSFLNVPNNKTVVLNLNGHTIDRAMTAATSNGYVMNIVGTLTVNDSSNPSTGKITGGWNSDGYGGCANIESGGTLTLNSGTITGNKIERSQGEAKGGAFYVGNNATFTMNGGFITNNSVSTSISAWGGAVCVNAYGNNCGTFNMNGGTITGNSVSGSDAKGGGVFLDHAQINAIFNLSGNGTITGNTANSTANNVFASTTNVITITNTLDAATRIGITAPAGQTVTSGLNGKGSLDNFICDNAASGFKLVLLDNEVRVETLGVAVAAKAATCTESGISQDCWLMDDHYYSDQACTQEINPVIPALGHDMSHHEATAATSTTSGCIEHWTCSRCGKYFLDEQGNEETNETAVSINPTVSYIDVDGSEKSVQATILTGSETKLYDGWYVAVGDVSFDHRIYLDAFAHVKIILADGATMSFGTSEAPLNDLCIEWMSGDNILSIYGQANGTGALAMYSNLTALNVNTVNIYGGHVSAQGGTDRDGINAAWGITIKGGNVHATGGDKGISSIGSKSIITLGWTKPADRIYASAYEYQDNPYSPEDKGSLIIALGQYLYNGEEVIGGTVTDLTKVNDKTLQPAVKMILPEGVTATGTNVFNQTDGTYALPGATVTLGYTTVPEGYVFTGYTVKDVNNDDVTVTETEGVYSFTMPAGDVTVSAIFTKIHTLFAENATNQWMTWCDDEEWTVPEGCTAYAVTCVTTTATGKAVVVTALTSGKLPAYTPVLVSRTTVETAAVTALCSGTVEAPTSNWSDYNYTSLGYSSDNGYAYGENEVVDGESNAVGSIFVYGNPGTVNSSVTGLVQVGNDNKTWYALYGDTFLRIDTDNGIPTNRCVLCVENSVLTWLDGQGSSNARQLAIVINDGEGTTGIASITPSLRNSLDRRNLSGQRVGQGYKGLVIVNGKKMIVR